MKTVLITGANGFIGRNLVAGLLTREDLELLLFDIENDEEDLRRWLMGAHVVIHLAGVNRAPSEADFVRGNATLTEQICEVLRRREEVPKIVMTSSIQAGRDSPYGRTKLKAEEALVSLAREKGAPVSIYRLKNVFGKWCRPNYNSVTATFCHNIARDLPIQISDPSREIELVYVDDVVTALISEIQEPGMAPPGGYVQDSIPSFRISLGDLAARIRAFEDVSSGPFTPDLSLRFDRCLYGTFMAYRPESSLAYRLDSKSDARGTLAEFIKSDCLGQVFVSRTRPGVTRGNHFHNTKAEKFLVLSGEGLIRLRALDADEVTELRVSGEELRVVDIPPGLTHSITNIGDTEMLTLFWASEPFDPDHPDTHYLPV